MNQKNTQLVILVVILLVIIIFVGGTIYLVQVNKNKVAELDKKAHEAYQELVNNNLNIPLGVSDPVVTIKLKESNCGDVNDNWAILDVLNQAQKVGEVKVNNCLAKTGEVLAQTKDKVYFTIPPVGVGGYIVYGKYINLYELNIIDSKITTILDNNYLTDLDFTTDRQKVVYLEIESAADNNPKNTLVIENLTNGLKAVYNLPEYDQFGDFQFSPLDDQVAFAAASGPENMKSAVYKLNLNSINNNPELVVEQTDKIYHVTGWQDNETVKYE